MSKTGETKIKNTKAAFLEAFCRLSRSEDPEKITVSALCREAGVNRTTFYKYYDVPADIIIETTLNLVTRTLQYDEHHRIDAEKTLLGVCRICCDHRDLLQLCMHLGDDLARMIYKTIRKSDQDLAFLDKPENIFLFGGITQTLLWWMMSDYEKAPEEMAEQLLSYVHAFQRSLSVSGS